MAENVPQEQVWDDSSLIDSWNEALAEYKKYHSLAAQGKTIDRETLAQEIAKLDGTMVDADLAQEVDQDESQMDAGAPAEVTQTNGNIVEDAPKVNGWAGHANTAGIPQALVNGVQDEGLKNLMMSWYYAGYYTGLYEGQQKAYATMQPPG